MVAREHMLDGTWRWTISISVAAQRSIQMIRHPEEAFRAAVRSASSKRRSRPMPV